MTTSEYWFWEKELSHETCQKLIALGKGKWKRGIVNSQNSDKKTLDKIRKSDVIWVTQQWVYDLIWKYMLTANEQAGWNYNIVAAESCQVTRYTKEGFYTWHKDGTGSHKEMHNIPGNEFLHGNARKLSMSILLNSDFEGGDFEIFSSYKTPKFEEGSIIVFPSFIAHRVAPITKGVRYSLVTWFLGPPFI